MKWFLILFFPFSWIVLRLFYIPGVDYVTEKVLYSIGEHLKLLYILLAMFLYIPYKSIATKWIAFNVFIYQACSTIFYCMAQSARLSKYDPVHLVMEWGKTIPRPASTDLSGIAVYIEFLFVPVFLLLNLAYLKMILTTYSKIQQSDDLNKEDIFLFVLKPKNITSFILTLFKRTPISGVFIYTNNLIYCFKKNSKRVQKIIYKNILNDTYVIINTGIKIKDRSVNLTNLYNEKWSYINNCIPIFSRAIGKNIYKIIKGRTM